MTSVDYPNSPTVGQFHSHWMWNGTAWMINKTGFSFVTDTAPIRAVTGQTWYQPSTGASYVWNSGWVAFQPNSLRNASEISFAPTTPSDPYVPQIAATNVQNATAEVAADISANYSLGIVAVGTMIIMADGRIAASANTPLTHPLYFTPLVGRRYRLKFRCRVAYPTVAACSIYLRTYGDNNLAGADTHTFLQSAHSSPEFEQVFDGTGTPSSYQINIIPNNAIGVYTEQPVSFFNIQDIGPAR